MTAENPIKAVLKEQAKAAARVEINPDKIPEQLTRSTSISILDRTMGGGLPSGSVAYILADPKSMARYSFINSHRRAKPIISQTKGVLHM